MMPVDDLNKLSRDLLHDLAGERSFARGEAYFEDERVRGLVEFAAALAATVEGTEDYRVKLWADGDSLGYACDCPYADEGNFCKHCVAVGLAWLSEKQHGDGSGVIRLDDVSAFLSGQDKSRLVEMILYEALDNERLCERLLLEAGQGRTEDVDARPRRT
jgi:uncharacterized Zn finger protein